MRLGEIGDHFAVAPERFVADGDTVVALANITWKHKHTGAPASVKMAHVWAFRDGKAARAPDELAALLGPFLASS